MAWIDAQQDPCTRLSAASHQDWETKGNEQILFTQGGGDRDEETTSS